MLSPVWAGSRAAADLSEETWIDAMLEVEGALARAQAQLGVIPTRSAKVITEVARGLRIDAPMLAERSRGAANPVVVLVQELTAAVREVAPAAADHVHLGSTSQDILDSAAMLLVGHTLEVIGQDLSRVAAALAVLARRHRATPMAARTLAQHAVPTTFGLKAAGWLDSVLDAALRVRQTAASLPAQLGGAAGTLAAYEEYARDTAAGRRGHGLELAKHFAAELGLVEPSVPWHSLRTPLCTIGGTLSQVTGVLGKFALDVQTLSRTEIMEVVEPTAEGRGVSSAMPQKRNPVLATLVVSAARQVPLHSAVLAQCMLAEDERAPGAWHAEWQPLREALRLTAGAALTAAELAEGLEVLPARMRRNLELTEGAVVAERLNAVLASRLGKAESKRVLAGCAQRAANGEVTFAEALDEHPELRGHLPADVEQLLAPEGYLGAAEDLVTRVLTRQAREETS
ncbi:3-carboxy-cis,cis-muconate cycloisomerase [Streptomyces yokosukanensis]|uniref:3-carboxy-cis,cis-muconate cycloisomerase n=1 Tax=Streptomyces yokosukanensis TaxID=67386 RepID=A0A101NTZ7_9ACTN|nr:lyase family protein [Streptomyces yokosukanensis]KUM99132.1 3-carboxy-cis,cis-muconate cycloisomerase [Streptomyces yokosukanensis]